MSYTNTLPLLQREFLVACFCADWCGTCRDYQTGFTELSNQFPAVGFLWVDIENTEFNITDWDIENFPTILIQRGDLVLYWGPMLPHLQILSQLLSSFIATKLEESHRYAFSTPERVRWQAEFNFRKVCLED